jgi:hypothetical protein
MKLTGNGTNYNGFMKEQYQTGGKLSPITPAYHLADILKIKC